MHPVLFRLAGHPVEANGVLYFLAVVVACVYGVRTARRHGWDPNDVLPGVILTALAAYLGARLHAAVTLEQWPPASLGELLRPRGLSFFGGLVTGSLAVLGYLRWRHIPAGAAADALAPLAPILYAMFRLGCLLNGDDYGRVTSAPWGMAFPEGSPPTLEHVHPTQVYEVALMLPVFLWLRRRQRAGLPPGAVAFELAVLMGAERFLVEFWRASEPLAGGFSAAQWLALGLVIIGSIGRGLLRPRPVPVS